MAVPVHPAASVPVTVYVVVPTGDTVTAAVAIPPGFQLYETPPAAVNVVLCPKQIVFIIIFLITL